MEEQLVGHNGKHEHSRIKIAFSGAAETGFLDNDALNTCSQIGAEIVKQGAVLISGATTGTPLWACRGAKEAGGLSVGLSPAGSEREHVELYKLPLEYMDFIIYTGFGYVGRDMLMTRTADAVVIGPGRVGTIHEFTVAFEDKKPIGIIEGDKWETDEVIKMIIDKSHRQDDNPFIVYDKDPKMLISKMLDMIHKNKIEHYKVYRASDKFTYKCSDLNCQNGDHNHDNSENIIL